MIGEFPDFNQLEARKAVFWLSIGQNLGLGLKMPPPIGISIQGLNTCNKNTCNKNLKFPLKMLY